MNDDLVQCTFSGPRDKNNELKSVIVRGQNKDESKVEFRLTKHNDIKSVQNNELASSRFEEFFLSFKQCLIISKSESFQILLNKKNKAKIIKQKKIEKSESKPHNRAKNYLIPDGIPCPFLIEIGVMTPKGVVKSNMFKKFKQINRFLEMVDDLYRGKDLSSPLHIVDFGCGKSYLTFAIYHYFTVIRNAKLTVTGVDLKEEVITHCNLIAKKLSYEGLKFVHGFIHDFSLDRAVDFVITLHACDTATDDAILFSLKHKAKNMIFVPCCQHELNKQLKNDASQTMLKHGIFRDRLTALITDTMRSQLLEVCGYKVQSMEFIDLEHTAKNIMIRCIEVQKTLEQKKQVYEQYLMFKLQWGIEPYLEKKLSKFNFLESIE